MLPVDGLWIDMNEISNFCNGQCSNGYEKPYSSVGFNPQTPPYSINNQGNKVTLNVKTLDMTAVHYGGVLEYNAHNLFGETKGKKFNRCQILIASTKFLCLHKNFLIYFFRSI